MLLDLRTSQYYSFNAVGGFVWQQLQRPHSALELINAIMAEYQVDRERCRSDLYVLLRELSDAGLVRMVEDGPA
jgi:hypothetical protein